MACVPAGHALALASPLPSGHRVTTGSRRGPSARGCQALCPALCPYEPQTLRATRRARAPNGPVWNMTRVHGTRLRPELAAARQRPRARAQWGGCASVPRERVFPSPWVAGALRPAPAQLCSGCLCPPSGPTPAATSSRNPGHSRARPENHRPADGARLPGWAPPALSPRGAATACRSPISHPPTRGTPATCTRANIRTHTRQLSWQNVLYLAKIQLIAICLQSTCLSLLHSAAGTNIKHPSKPDFDKALHQREDGGTARFPMHSADCARVRPGPSRGTDCAGLPSPW